MTTFRYRRDFSVIFIYKFFFHFQFQLDNGLEEAVNEIVIL